MELTILEGRNSHCDCCDGKRAVAARALKFNKWNDRVLMCTSCYEGFLKFCSELLASHGKAL